MNLTGRDGLTGKPPLRSPACETHTPADLNVRINSVIVNGKTIIARKMTFFCKTIARSLIHGNALETSSILALYMAAGINRSKFIVMSVLRTLTYCLN